MSIEILKISAEEWNAISFETMKLAFNEIHWDEKMNRVSYAILAQDRETKTPYGFATIVEMDGQTAYVQHGGTFPSTHSTAVGGRGFLKIIEHLRHKYYHVQMRVKNTNTAMLKLCLKAGFITTGVQLDKLGNLYLFQDLVETYG